VLAAFMSCRWGGGTERIGVAGIAEVDDGVPNFTVKVTLESPI
jgi:hypothetical protein